jgi:hypothetical protein
MSSRYVRGEMDHIWKETWKDARFIAQKGWDVIRVKIEAVASIEGIPQTEEEARKLPEKSYFEFHMVFCNKDDSTPSEEQLAQVKVLAKKLEKEYIDFFCNLIQK